MRVLYVNHTSLVSGGERSLLTLLPALPPEVSPVLACPPGPLADEAARLGVEVWTLPGTAGSLKLHPWHTARAVSQLGRAAFALRRLARRAEADLVHANTIRAGLVASASARLGAPRPIVHVRDCLPPGRVTAVTRRLIGRQAAMVLANSAYTRDHFVTADVAVPARVVHSPVDLRRFDPDGIPREEARTELGLRPSELALAVVAQITPWKAQDDAVRMLARLRRKHPQLRLLLAGSTKFVSGATRYDNRAFLRAVEGLIESNGLRGAVHLLGERDDVPRLLRAVDVLLVPSWEEPFGRSVVEAMAMGVPVVATSAGGPAEVVRHGEEGLLVPPRDPDRWARAVATLVERPELRGDMGRKGRRRARDFGAEQHARAVVDAYHAVQTGRGRPDSNRFGGRAEGRG
jgi:glycosyltransferase involved in cell wall biosynthesis